MTGAVKCAESKFQQMCTLFDSYFCCFYREWNFNKKSMLKPGWQQERQSVEAMPWWKGREHIGRVGKKLVFCLGNSCEIRGLLLCSQDCLLAVKKIRGGKGLSDNFARQFWQNRDGVRFFPCVTAVTHMSWDCWTPMWFVWCYVWQMVLSSRSRTDWSS